MGMLAAQKPVQAKQQLSWSPAHAVGVDEGHDSVAARRMAQLVLTQVEPGPHGFTPVSHTLPTGALGTRTLPQAVFGKSPGSAA